MHPITRFAQLVGKQRWFTTIGKRIVPIDFAIQKRSGGRLSLLRAVGLPCLLLTVTGRRTGQARSVPLLYSPHGGEFLVVGSNWGERRHPAWSANLLANPEATVQVRGQEVPVLARHVTGAERDKLWAELVLTWPGYDAYAERAGGRELRLFVLTPRTATASAGRGRQRT